MLRCLSPSLSSVSNFRLIVRSMRISRVGSEEAPLGLASVRRSNGPYSFPVGRFHRGVVRGRKGGTSDLKRTSPYSPSSLRSGRCCHPALRHRL